jgi:trk system potassium uptake protein TrkA
MPKKRFAVLGLGRFGGYVARQLHANGCEVIGVDSNRARVEELAETLDSVVIADATDKRALGKLGLDQVDAAVVSLGDKTELSTLAVLHLKDLRVKQIIAKVTTEDHARILTRLGADEVVFPERDSALRVANGLTWSNLVDYVPLASGYTIMEVSPPKEIVGKSLADSKLRTKYGVQVIAIHRVFPDTMILAPPPDHVFTEEDALIILGDKQNVEKLLGAAR